MCHLFLEGVTVYTTVGDITSGARAERAKDSVRESLRVRRGAFVSHCCDIKKFLPLSAIVNPWSNVDSIFFLQGTQRSCLDWEVGMTHSKRLPVRRLQLSPSPSAKLRKLAIRPVRLIPIHLFLSLHSVKGSIYHFLILFGHMIGSFRGKIGCWLRCGCHPTFSRFGCDCSCILERFLGLGCGWVY